MKLKKVLLSILAMLPISSIAFAVEYNLQGLNIKENVDPAKVEAELLERLAENQLPTKYYQFLVDHNIESSEQLESPEFTELKKRLIEEYIKDYKTPMARSGGTISVF